MAPKKKDSEARRDLTGWFRIEAASAIVFVIGIVIFLAVWAIARALGIEGSFAVLLAFVGAAIACVVIMLKYRNKLFGWAKSYAKLGVGRSSNSNL